MAKSNVIFIYHEEKRFIKIISWFVIIGCLRYFERSVKAHWLPQHYQPFHASHTATLLYCDTEWKVSAFQYLDWIQKNTVQKEVCIWILFTQSDVAKRIVLTFLRLNYSLSSQLKLLHSKEEIKKSGCISELTVDGQCNPPGVSATHNTVSVIDAGKNEVRIFMVVHVKLLQTIFIAVDCYF